MSGLETDSNSGRSNLAIDWNPGNGTVVLEPHGPLAVHDFNRLASIIDPWIHQHGSLHGIVIRVQGIPGWKDFESFIRHIRFVRDHHHKVERIAVAGDGIAMEILPKIGSHFINAEVKKFDYDNLTDAKIWVATPGGHVH